MKKINLKGVTKEAVVGVLVLLVAFVNAVLQMFGIQTLPIKDSNIESVCSTAFLFVTIVYNVYKNRNISSASQSAQKITDAIKNGEILIEQIDMIIDTVKASRENMDIDKK